MVILEKPYISPEMVQWLADTAHPVLDNDTAREVAATCPLNLVQSDEFAARVNAGERLYTTNENSLDWVYTSITDENLLRAVSIMKDKVAMRRALQPMYPEYRFRELSVDHLQTQDPDTLPYPFVLKPSVGFFSVGVYVVKTPDQWRSAVQDIVKSRQAWEQSYSGEVVGKDLFILEDLIPGDEFAIDAYFDESGHPVIVNIMRHEFSSGDDVSDRLYYTGPAIIRAYYDRFTEWLATVNKHLGVRSFPIHVEVRATDQTVVPVEFNPLRFAGLCTTDITSFAYGFFTYACYLANRRPEWKSILAGMDDSLYSMIILDKPKSVGGDLAFNYQALRDRFTHVLSLREYHGDELPIYGFLFTRTEPGHRQELDAIMHSDLREFLQ